MAFRDSLADRLDASILILAARSRSSKPLVPLGVFASWREEYRQIVIDAVEVGGKNPEQAARDWIEAKQAVRQQWIPAD